MTIHDFGAVLSAARSGAEWAWKTIYGDIAPAVLGYLRSRGASDPEDLTGEVFLHVVRGLGGFEGDERAFRSWVFTVAHHRLVDDRRRRARRPESSHADVPERAGDSDPEADALERMSDDRVRAMLADLSPDQRDVLLLRLVGGLTLQETADATGKRLTSVKALQRRGLAALKRMMENLAVSL